jgi:hypothetical protein
LTKKKEARMETVKVVLGVLAPVLLLLVLAVVPLVVLLSIRLGKVLAENSDLKRELIWLEIHHSNLEGDVTPLPDIEIKAFR